MPRDIAEKLYDFLRADWPIFVAYMATQHGWSLEQCQEAISALASTSLEAL